MFRDIILGAAAWTAVCFVFAAVHHVMRRRLAARKPIETNDTERN